MQPDTDFACGGPPGVTLIYKKIGALSRPIDIVLSLLYSGYVMQKTHRGTLHLTRETYRRFKRYMKKMQGVLYYCSLPVENRDAKRNVWIHPDGKKRYLSF